jgi:shikimate kinase
MNENKNIIFVGLMGSGKTTIGKQVSKALDMEFCDTDHAVEVKTGVNIATIFELEGEEGFRLREHNLLVDLMDNQKKVIATGGGIVLNGENRKLLRQLGTVVYLRSNIKDLILRLRNDNTRPLIQNVNLDEKFNELFNERDPLYIEVADYIIDTKNKKVSDIKNEILELLNKCKQ